MSSTPLVKICGLTTPADAVEAASAGADWIGLNFHPPSPRFLNPESARSILRALPPHVVPVGLFVNRPPAQVAEIADQLNLRVVQLHGDEPPETIAALSSFKVVRAFRLRDPASISAMLAYLQETEKLGHPPEAILIDAFVEGLPGGTGRSIADSVLKILPNLPRLILAGGLTPENVAERSQKVRPWMVDVAGGVELSPGRKDPQRMRAFVSALKGNDGPQ
ncbi:MAG TPA: phosphoribosylanthranilate isomerase [Isosphaeraceae bacterium]|nr:phosphoribosylanthranilate isomerase [Isosphaeraceae bacterium]